MTTAVHGQVARSWGAQRGTTRSGPPMDVTGGGHQLPGAGGWPPGPCIFAWPAGVAPGARVRNAPRRSAPGVVGDKPSQLTWYRGAFVLVLEA